MSGTRTIYATDEQTALDNDMAKIKPFRGYRYNPGAANIGDVIAPPYDVISPKLQDELYARHEKNVVRLILGKEFETDSPEDNRYTRSAVCLQGWLADKTLVRDEKPALYLYAQDYDVGGGKKRRVGFICRRLVEPLGESIYPHERTLSGPKTDRLNLTRACRMNFSPVFGLYSDHSRKLDAVWGGVMESKPDISVTDGDGVSHHMWAVADEAIIAQAAGFLETLPVVIADGHHRYETALNYRNERRAGDKTPEGEAEYDYVMMYLSNSLGEGFTVLPTHRVVIGLLEIEHGAVMEKLGEYFDITDWPLDKDSLPAFFEELRDFGMESPSFGMYSGGGRASLLALKTGVDLARELAHITPPALRGVDVTVLQEIVFEKILGVTRQMVADKKNVSYTIDAAEAIGAVDGGRARLAFLMNGADMEKVIEVATAGGVMPQKSTYFYPKLVTGLVMNPLE